MPPRFHPTAASPLYAALVAFVLTALCAGAIIASLERREDAQERTQVADLASDHARALQRSIELALSANNALAALVRQGNGNVPDFEAIGTQMLPFYPGIAALGLAPQGVVQHVVPLPRWPGQIPPPLATPNSPRQDRRIMTTRVRRRCVRRPP